MNDLKFTKTHEWLKVAHDGVIVGITNHAQELLGDMVFVELPNIGDAVKAGDELGVVESVKAASDFYAPIGGVVTAVNTRAVDDPALINSSPYDAGWLVKLKPNRLSEIEELLTDEQYQQEIA
jgi:glycine cleavage system H protein